jgi:hypothetical protein
VLLGIYILSAPLTVVTGRARRRRVTELPTTARVPDDVRSFDARALDEGDDHEPARDRARPD